MRRNQRFCFTQYISSNKYFFPHFIHLVLPCKFVVYNDTKMFTFIDILKSDTIYININIVIIYTRNLCFALIIITSL